MGKKVKLMIEISEEEYEIIKTLIENTVIQNLTVSREFLEAIANGTPIDKGDLVMFNLLMETIADKGLPFEEVLLLIDNAPTVEPICPYLSDNEVKQPCLNSPCERPQGEWIKNNYGEHHCNKCGHFALYEEYDDEFIENASRFCPHCGADMRKGGAE